MTEAVSRWIEYGVFLVLVIGLAHPVGLYLARVFEGERTFLDPLMRPIEQSFLRVLGPSATKEMSARTYIISFLTFSAVGTIGLFSLLMLQDLLPGGPSKADLSTPMTFDLALNTAVSFATTTTWQAYAGESTLRYLVQAIGLISQNFVAGAAGLAVGVAFIRGIAREHSPTIGNFWVDLVRGVLWVLLPLSILGSIILVWQGVPMNLAPYTKIHTLEGGAQTIAQGPVAALEFIKNLGTNGGGFFNVNAAHPYENPTPVTNFLASLAIAVLPAALTVTFGRMAGRPKAGWVLLGVMAVLFIGGLCLCDRSESVTPPYAAALHLSGANMEGKETRFGIGDSVLTAVVTSNGATGSYNSMHDSYRPIGVLVLLGNMLLGDIVFGGLGSGLYGMVVMALVAAFIGGLMIGRTPTYLGKRIGQAETQLAVLFTLLTPAVVLILTATALSTPWGRAGLTTNTGAHGFTEVFFAYASAMANNGQSMAGLSANTPFYNVTTIVTMIAGRFGLAALALSLAGRFAAQGRLATTPATLPNDSTQFGVLLFSTIMLVGGLCFLPALALGPLWEAIQR